MPVTCYLLGALFVWYMIFWIVGAVPTPDNKVAALGIILEIIGWFVLEVGWGGGDPTKGSNY